MGHQGIASFEKQLSDCVLRAAGSAAEDALNVAPQEGAARSTPLPAGDDTLLSQISEAKRRLRQVADCKECIAVAAQVCAYQFVSNHCTTAVSAVA